MASEISNHVDKPVMNDADLIAFVKKELDADDEHQAQISAAGAGEVPHESQTGATLDLSRKNIGTLPMGMITLIKDKVERLALSHNPRMIIPVEIGQCDRLRYLNLRWNRLQHFPEAVLALSKLEILDISKNAIEVIPEEIKRMNNLKFLALSRNQIRRLPLALGEMNLVKLKFDENPIEFPPLDQLRSANEHPESMPESERDKEICQQVKRFMRVELRERSRAASEEDVSNESNVETPRPPRRTNTGGRFPVRPSIGGVDQMFPDARSSPPNPPPIPQRSHARVTSSSSTHSSLRPVIAPLVTSNLESNRSRSETVATSASVRSRRQGYVQRKTSSNLGSVSEADNMSPYSRATTTNYTPSHSRAASSASAFAFLGVGSGGDSSSAAASPIDIPPSARLMSSRKLFSLPESRNSIQPTINSIKAVKRVLYILFYLYRPVADIALQIKSGSPLRSGLSRQVTTANAHVEELDRLITCVNGIIEENAELDPTLLMSIIRTAVTALQSYTSIVRDLASKQQRTLRFADPFLIRSLLNVAYSTNVEAQNVCRVLGFQTTAPKLSRTPGAWSSRTITPTQPRHPKMRRTRGPTILPNSVGGASTRTKAPPVPLLGTGVRVNSVSSLGGVTPRSDVFMNGPPAFSRSSTLRSVLNESDGSEDGPEKGFLKLKACCEIASQTLPSIRSELAARKTAAENMGHSKTSYHFHLAMTKCEAIMATCTRLSNRLRLMRVTDPTRVFPELEQMFKAFSRDWTNFVEECRALTQQQSNLTSVKTALKPVHAAVKDVARVLVQSSAYTPSASRGVTSYVGLPQAPISKFSTVSVTPLGAALGPAVRATVVNSAPYAQLDNTQSLAPSGMRSTQDRPEPSTSYYSHGR